MYPASSPLSGPSFPAQTMPTYGAAQPALPKSNSGWAAATIIFFWPLAFAAFNHSARVYPLWATGDYTGAEHASDRTKRLGKTALWIFVILNAMLIAFYILMIAMVAGAGDYSSY